MTFFFFFFYCWSHFHDFSCLSINTSEIKVGGHSMQFDIQKKNHSTMDDDIVNIINALEVVSFLSMWHCLPVSKNSIVCFDINKRIWLHCTIIELIICESGAIFHLIHRVMLFVWIAQSWDKATIFAISVLFVYENRETKDVIQLATLKCKWITAKKKTQKLNSTKQTKRLLCDIRHNYNAA